VSGASHRGTSNRDQVLSAVPVGAETPDVDVVVIGAGPAGLSAALNLARSRHRVLVLDANRPRNAATLASHGYLTRDGISPLELRKLGLAELDQYPDTAFQRARVDSIRRVANGFAVAASGHRGAAGSIAVRTTTRMVVLASGLSEVLPELPSIHHYYGTSLHSCLVCDGYEKRDQALALLGETDDLAERALLVSRWSRNLIVFTNGVGMVTAEQEAVLAERGIRVERAPIRDVVGDRSGMTGVALESGEVIARVGGFIRPRYVTTVDYAGELNLAVTAEGFLEVDAYGRTSVPWVYAAGDLTPPGPKQLIIAAGAGAMVAGGINRDETLQPASSTELSGTLK
jgi:thioredoxin reductase